jgi:ribose transport system ATP-binding protein
VPRISSSAAAESSPLASSEYVLQVRNVSKAFPGVQALDNVSFDLKPGEVHVLLGENGAGKSTLMKIIAGAYLPDAGEILIDGQPAANLTPRKAQELGVGIIYQEFNLIPFLNVAENIFIDQLPTRQLIRLDHKTAHRKAREILASLNMEVPTHALAVELSTAQQQIVEVAKALTHNSRILIMDEPTASLTDREIEQLFMTIRELKSKGIGIIYISHRLREMKEIGDRVTVLRDGRYVGTHNLSEVTVDSLVTMMVGREIDLLYEHDEVSLGEEVLRVEGLSSKATGLRDVSMNLRRGEIVGLAGLVGSGRTELARAIFNADRHDEGRIIIFGKESKGKTPKDSVRNRIALLPEDRKRQGLALILSVAENVLSASLDKVFPRGWVDQRKQKSLSDEYIKILRIATPSGARITRDLSGGNQQKVVIAKWLATGSEIFIFDEPTRGIDVGAKCEIYGFMNHLKKNNCAVLMISSELPEVIGMSDRIFVMREGTIVAEVSRGEATQEKIISYAMDAAPERPANSGTDQNPARADPGK